MSLNLISSFSNRFCFMPRNSSWFPSKCVAQSSSEAKSTVTSRRPFNHPPLLNIRSTPELLNPQATDRRTSCLRWGDGIFRVSSRFTLVKWPGVSWAELETQSKRASVKCKISYVDTLRPLVVIHFRLRPQTPACQVAASTQASTGSILFRFCRAIASGRTRPTSRMSSSSEWWGP